MIEQFTPWFVTNACSSRVMDQKVDGSDSYRSISRSGSGMSSISTRSGIRCDCRRYHITKVCTSHEVVCCVECCFEKHRSCNVEQIKDRIKHFSLKEENESQDLTKQLDVLRHRRISDLKQLMQEKNSMQPKIHQVYDKLKCLFESREKEDVDKGETIFETFNETVNNDIEACTKTIDALKAVQSSEDSESRFIRCLQARELIGQIKLHSGNESLQFLADGAAEQKLKSMKFGYFLGEKCMELSYLGKYDITYTREGCDIRAICELPDGTLFLDCGNLVQLDINYKPVCHTDLEEIPSGVCYMNDGKVAICLKSKKYEGLLQIFSVSVGPKSLSVGLCKEQSIFLGFIGLQVACTGDNLLIKEHKTVYTCTKMGKKGTMFYDGKNDDSIIDIKTNETMTKVYIADREKGIIVLDKNGKSLLGVSDPDLHDMCSICVNTKGSIFVACKETRRILLFDENGEKQGLVINLKQEGEPLCVAVQNKYNRLLVTLKSSSEVRVYDMES